ncbi:Crp/Fnr family transcriptional regulator [Hydrogenophaga sp. RWCD_12]|uniref:Crp/Fnr family transcriptional regulator n=1 Tax=Hydrogenophaga sp. RWCD_12 TaxID=3391190 RepID=UPI0039852FBC
MDLSRFDLPRYLSMLPLFQEMRAEELQRLAQGSRLRQFARGEDVFRTGEPCEEFHVTVSGQVKLFAISPAGQEKIIELVGPGSTFAEALMFMERPYIINAQALTDTLMLSVSREAVLREIHNDPQFSMRMLAGLSRRLHGLVNDVQAYSLHSGVERVIGYLVRDLPEDGGETAASVLLPVSKASIASRLSMTPEYFSKVLRELEDKGLIEVDKREIRIPDPQRLTRYPLR